MAIALRKGEIIPDYVKEVLKKGIPKTARKSITRIVTKALATNSKSSMGNTNAIAVAVHLKEEIHCTP